MKDQALNLQPTLRNEFVTIRPIRKSDFEELFRVASDPLIWEQHPDKERHTRDRFEIFFNGAVESGGGLVVFDSKTGQMIGSSRYHDYNEAENSIVVGYTFLARDHWGTTYNRALKKLMLDYIFQLVGKVLFRIGENNVRSQKEIEKLGAIKTGEAETDAPDGKRKDLSYVYCIDKETWKRKASF